MWRGFLHQSVETFFMLASSWWLIKTEAPRVHHQWYIQRSICGILLLLFESITIARLIADKLEGQGFDVEILDQGGEVIIRDPADPYRYLLGAHH
jgi:hypothetical protein